jgi:hypothetical protein
MAGWVTKNISFASGGLTGLTRLTGFILSHLVNSANHVYVNPPEADKFSDNME